MAAAGRRCAETSVGALVSAHDRVGEDVAAHVAAAAARAEVDAQDAAAVLAAAADELSALRRARQSADTRRSVAQRAADATRTAAEQADAAYRDAAAARDALAAEPRLAALLGVDEIVPDTDASALVERLTGALAAAEQERTGLLVEQTRDQRVLRALGEGGLLPEPAEIEDVLRVLEAAGITAYSGWRYLAMLPAETRDAVVERLPHLVGGVLLNNAADAATARAALAAARLLPSAVVAVGTTAAMASDEVAPGVALVVPPNPAMVDEEAAARVRAELTDATQTRSAGLERLTSGLERDRELLIRVRAWRDRRPTLGELAAAADASRARMADAAAAAADAEVVDLDARAEALEADRPRSAAAATATREHAAALAGLVAETGRVVALRERIRGADVDAARAERQAAAAREESGQAREDADAARRRQDRHAGVVERVRAELAELPLDESDDGDLSAAPEADGLPLGVLRGAYTQACAAYAAAEVGADLSAQLGMAERDARSAQVRVDALDPAARASAEALLHSPDAADPTARRAAADQARDELAREDKRRQQAVTARALAAGELARFTTAPRPAAPYDTPTSPADGREQVERAEQDRRAAEDAAARACSAGA